MKKVNKQNIAISVKARLSNIANNQNVPYHNIEMTFLLERMVARLIKNRKLAGKIIFKGGYVGLRVYNSPRYTIDIDAIINNLNIKNISSLIIKVIEADIDDGVWYKYEKESDLVTSGECGGIRFYFRSGIGEIPKNIKIAKNIHFDIGTGDIVVPAPKKIETKSILGEESLSWLVYTIESTCAEKIHALFARSYDNSRSKDIFDLYYFLPKCNLNVLNQAIAATFKARNDILPENLSSILKDIDVELLKLGWKSAIAGLKDDLDFDLTFRGIIDYFENLEKE
ncbi:MAG: nucleotidyl transferase AbiEii/AbiGii toxin family protein [Pseudomonadota bacterium]